MSYDPEASVARPLLALTSPGAPSASSAYSRRRRRNRLVTACGALTLVLLFSYAYLGPAAGLPVPERIAPYAYRPRPLPEEFEGNAPPPPGGWEGGHAHAEPPTPGDAEQHPPPLDVPGDADDLPAAPSSPPSQQNSGSHASAPPQPELEPSTLPAARSRYTLKTGRSPPRGFDAFYSFATERGCMVDAYDGVYADFAAFWKAENKQKGWFRERVLEMANKLKSEPHGITVLTLGTDGAPHQPTVAGGYFDGDWARTISQFSANLPPMTLLINGRDEPRVVFDVAGLYNDAPALQQGVAVLSDPRPFTLSPSPADAFFADRPGCTLPRGVGKMEDVSFLISPSSAEFTTDLVPVLSMTKLADGASGVASLSASSISLPPGPGSSSSSSSAVKQGGDLEGEHTCFADIMMPGVFYYRNSWWAGKFDYPDNVKWEDKKDVLYWRGKSNGGHIRFNNYRSFPRFRLMDLARRPESVRRGLFDVKITQWHEWHCTDHCDADEIRKEYNITDDAEPREDAYKFKYLLDIDGNSFSGRYLGLMRTGGLVFKSTSFAEFFTPWLIPYEHFIPVRPDLEDLVEKIEWARANDAEAHRIQQSGQDFAERVLTDAQNDCYWFNVVMEWGAIWEAGEV